VAAREEIVQVPCDVLVPAAVENTVNGAAAERLRAKAVVPGANLAVAAEAGALLYRAGVLVLPDFLSGCGGSLAMEGLFAPREHPTPEQVLAHVERRMMDLVREVLARSAAEEISPTAAALRLCAEIIPRPGRPYGDPIG
jgi:glutamate dehydrogenase (NAD(P)+)